MLFSTAQFGIFFIVYFILHMLTPFSWRITLIIAGSTVFYGWWMPKHVWVPFAIAVIGYAGVAWIEAGSADRERRRRLIAVVTAIFLPLAIFKYFDFLYVSFAGPISGESQGILNLALPLGLSFITFTVTAYVVDVARGIYPRERDFPRFLGYVLFFPHLNAGPILRPQEL